MPCTILSFPIGLIGIRDKFAAFTPSQPKLIALGPSVESALANAQIFIDNLASKKGLSYRDLDLDYCDHQYNADIWVCLESISESSTNKRATPLKEINKTPYCDSEGRF